VTAPRGAALVLAAAALVTACSAPVLPARLKEAERFERLHRYDEALRAYDAELGVCRPDAARCGQAALGKARLLEHLDRQEEALAAYLAVPGWDRHGRTPARALYRAAEVAARLGRVDEGLRLAWRAVREYPATVAGKDAVRLITARRRERGETDRLYAELGAAAASLAKTDVADTLLLALGDVAEQDRHDPDDAVRIWDRLAARYPASSLRDDALWRAAQARRGRGDPHGAIARLRVITNQRRVALLMGSFISEWLDDALLLIGRIYRDDLKDPRHAINAFEDLRDNFTASPLRDDAQLEIARTWLGTGDRQRACAALARLAQDFPQSRFNRREARTLAAEAGCR
jgi:tetratricopeptide (TPR) repeat protein